MTRFMVHINLDNAAFQDGNEGAELARLLRFVADNCENHGTGDDWDLRDINGNIVGETEATNEAR